MQKNCRNEQNQSRKIFLVSILSTTRNGFSLLSSCQREFILFSHVLSTNFHPKTRKVCKSEFFFLIVKPQFHKFQSSCVTVETIKVKFFLLKICEELSAKQTPESEQILSLQIRLVMSQKRTVRQRFFTPQVCLFSFSTMPHNDRGYGHLAVCGNIRCRGTTK